MMYAVISTGGKQYRVEQGQRLLVERLGEVDSNVELKPVMLVDGDSVLATPESLSGSKVTARIVADAKGPKIRAFTYKNKSNQRRRWGHRQKLAEIEITGIKKGEWNVENQRWWVNSKWPGFECTKIRGKGF